MGFTSTETWGSETASQQPEQRHRDWTGLIESKEQQGDQYDWNGTCVKESGRRGRQKGAKLRSAGACRSYLGLRGSLKWHLKPLENFECNDMESLGLEKISEIKLSGLSCFSSLNPSGL